MIILTKDNIYKYSFILDLYINTTFAFMNKSYKPLSNIFKHFFRLYQYLLAKQKKNLTTE